MNQRKQEAQQQEQRTTFVVNVNITRGTVALLIAGMLLAALLGYLAWGQQRVSAATPQVPEAPAAPAAGSGGLRKYYRTDTAFSPTLASTACGTGYHFASIWELLDPSNLEYAGERPDAWGGPLYDMGEGPPTGAGGLPLQGYVRTGYGTDASGYPGQGNCDNWTSDNENHYGTVAGVSHEWGTAEDLFAWNIDVTPCNIRTGVWCVED
jgi:hypothetical protein